mmetsp:Transcript_19088/g.18219  ORF Transcript_19088/g.18219 Transcript_19088/m.18219 type:complete len:332 (+) Transcript_19088:7-1002(+)
MKKQGVDLAALSMSGSLMPCEPLQFYVKYDPPKITLVYHFERNKKDQYFHDINLDRKTLETSSDEDICNLIYVTEAYYFDPKKIKRQQIIGLIRRLKEELRKNKMDNQTNPREEGHGAKKNFLERKGINNDMIKNFQDNEYEDDFDMDSNRLGGQANKQNYEEDPFIQGKGQGSSPQQDMRRPVQGTLNQGNNYDQRFVEGNLMGMGDQYNEGVGSQRNQNLVSDSNSQNRDSSEKKKNPTYDDLFQEFTDEQDPQTAQPNNNNEEDGKEQNPDNAAQKELRRIQIEGEDEEYQMDEDGNIYDLLGNFIGVANPDEIEELAEYDPELQDDL